MKITRTTLWSDVFLLINKENIDQLKEEIKECSDFDFWSLTIGDFSDIISNQLPEKLKRIIERNNSTVFEVIKHLNALDKFIAEFQSILESLNIELDSDEKDAASYCISFTSVESMLIFAQKYFFLHDFGSAEKITLLEYVLARKKDYSDNIYERTLSRIRLKNMK